jgi:hypothetical protein
MPTLSPKRRNSTLKRSGEQSRKSGSQRESTLTEPDVRADVLGAGVIEPLEDDAAIKADPVRVAIVVQEEEEGAGCGGGVAGSPW